MLNDALFCIRCAEFLFLSPGALLTRGTRSSGQRAFSPSAERYFVTFWFPIFVEDENWEPKASRFHAAAGDKDVVLERPRTSCY